MKRLFYFIAAFAAISFSSCQKIDEPKIEEKVNESFTFNISVANPENTDTKAVKTGWEAGDIINLWFDGYDTNNPQVVMTYNGTSWSSEQKADLSLSATGCLSALYESQNDLANANVPLVLSCENVPYTLDGTNEVTASLNTWEYKTPIQIVVQGISENFADYSLSCADLCAGDGIIGESDSETSSFAKFSISNAAYGKATTGVANAGGAAFYFTESNASAEKAFTFVLSYNGKSYSYTSKPTTIFADGTTVKRVNKKLPAFAIDSDGNLAEGNSWSVYSPSHEEVHTIVCAEEEWSTIDHVLTWGNSKWGFSIVAEKASDSNSDPAYISTGNDCRIYAGGTIAISNESSPITKVVFNISTQGLKRLAPISASTGAVATQTSGDTKVVWTSSDNNTKSVSFTVGAQAYYGSEGSSKAGQLDFVSIDITSIESGEPVPVVSLTSIAVSGAPTKTSYTDGDSFETTGLVVTGTYSNNTSAEITEGITWAVNPETLTAGITSCSVVATVGDISSDSYSVSGLTVSEAPAEPFDVTISSSDIPDGFTATTGTSGNFIKDNLSINYSGINTKSKASASDHQYGYAMFLKNYGYIYSSSAPDGYYVSKVVATFSGGTGTSGKVGVIFGSSAITSRDTSVTGSVSQSGTCTGSNYDKSKKYWNFSTTGANVQVTKIVVTYSPVM